MFIHELAEWPGFTWDEKLITSKLPAIRYAQGRLFGKMEALGFELREEAQLRALTQDVIKTSEIEGEFFEPEQVRSSIGRRLGMDVAGLAKPDQRVEGVVEMSLDAATNFEESLSLNRLFSWHSSLFPEGLSNQRRLRVGAWRDDARGPMQVVSGSVGKERIHFQAPAASRIPEEMEAFLRWFNSEELQEQLLKAALAHLWFVTIHPFDDGNGRVARAIADLCLARSEGSPERFYSMSARIQSQKKEYYRILEETQRGGLDVTGWMSWFLECLSGAFEDAEKAIAHVLFKSRFWERHSQVSLNERQIQLLNRLLEGFRGKLTTSKWAKISKCSQDTAYRDIQGLMNYGILEKSPEGGRSTNYVLAELETPPSAL